jgi:septal ring factor EnvC (AmiA/AmiB activator)
MDDVDQTLKVVGAVLGIMAIVFPIVAGAVMWKMSRTFATRASLRGGLTRLDRRMTEKITQVEKDFERSHTAIMAAIRESRDATREDINGLGVRIEAIQRVAEIATSQADNARHEGDILREQVNSIDEHGTKRTAKLEEQINALSNNLSLFNKLIEQGILQPSRTNPER